MRPPVYPMYKTYVIHRKEDITECPSFAVDHFMWNSILRPKTCGRMAYLSEQGLFVQMTCNETNPKRDFKHHRDMVCKDSAMEAFFVFDSKAQPTEDSLYFNFDINAHGAMYAKYGRGRSNRQFISDDEYRLAGVQAKIEENHWSVELLISNKLLERVCGIPGLSDGDVFHCNFYKISEDPRIEHYAAYSPIKNDKPNFHMPQYFAKAVVCDAELRRITC